jgi:DNA-binding transcriptional LysR family regulator
MTFRNMTIFLSVCDHDCSVSKAAKALFISQPSVTQAIRDIEREYNVILFERLGKKLYITDAGQRFRHYAMRVTSIMQDMSTELSSWDKKGLLRIGASMTIGEHFLPQYIEHFRKCCPGLSTIVKIEPSRVLEERLLRNELDLALTEIPVHHQDLITNQYMTDTLELITPAMPPYQPDMRFDHDALSHLNFLLREKGSGSREIFDQAMTAAGIQVHVLWESSSTTAILNAVRHGLGVSIVPRKAAEQDISEGKLYRAHAAGCKFTQGFYTAVHKDKLITKNMLTFMNLIQEISKGSPSQLSS